MAKVGELFINLVASTASFSKDLKRSTKLTKQSAQAMTKAFKIVGVAIAAVGTSLAVLTKKSIDAADNLAKLSEKTGISTEALSKLEFAASQSGINLETLSQRMVNLARRAKEGDRGVLSYKQAFDKLKISLRDGRGQLKGTEELLLDVADRFSKMEDGTLKAALATDIFSNQGVALIPFLNQGREGIKALTDQAERLGLVIDSKTAKAAEKFNDSLDSLKFAVVGVGNRIAAALLPQLNKLTDATVDFATRGDGAKRLAENIAAAFKLIGAAGLVAAFSLNKLNELISAFTGTGDPTIEFLKMERRKQEEVAGLERELQKRIAGGFKVSAETLKKQLIVARDELEAISLLVRQALSEVPAGGGGFPQLFKGVGNLQELGEQISKLFSDVAVDVAASTDRVKTALGGVNAAVTDLNKVIVESPVAKPPFDQNALISQREELEFIGRALGGIPPEVEKIGGAFEALKGPLVDVRAIGETLTSSLSAGFQNLILSGGKFSDVLSNLAKQLASMFLQIALINTIKGIFGGIGIFGFQHGGRPQAGRPALVGEAGPELFVPDRSGTIISNQALQSVARGGGAKTVIIEQHFDFRGAGPGVMAEVRRGIRLAAQEIRALTKADIVEASLRSA